MNEIHVSTNVYVQYVSLMQQVHVYQWPVVNVLTLGACYKYINSVDVALYNYVTPQRWC